MNSRVKKKLSLSETPYEYKNKWVFKQPQKFQKNEN